MTDVNLTMVLISAALLGCGVYLLLERSLSRVLVGLVLIGNGVSLAFIVASGPSGNAPIVGSSSAADMADPLPQAMVLTAIVITLATTSFVLAMAYRSWQLNEHDDVQDDVEDAAIRRRATADVTSEAYTAASAASAENPDDSDFPDDGREAAAGERPSNAPESRP